MSEKKHYLEGLTVAYENYDVNTGKQCKDLLVAIEGFSNGQHTPVKFPDGKTKKVPTKNLTVIHDRLTEFLAGKESKHDNPDSQAGV